MSRTFSGALATAAALTILSTSIALAGSVKVTDHRHPETAPAQQVSAPATASKPQSSKVQTSAAVATPSLAVRDHRSQSPEQKTEKRLQLQVQDSQRARDKAADVYNQANDTFNQAHAAAAAHPNDPAYASKLQAATVAKQTATTQFQNSNKQYEAKSNEFMGYNNQQELQKKKQH